jgi:hypothetical protein
VQVLAALPPAMLSFHVTGGRCAGPLLVDRGKGLAAVGSVFASTRTLPGLFLAREAGKKKHDRKRMSLDCSVEELCVQVVAALGQLPPSTPPEKVPQHKHAACLNSGKACTWHVVRAKRARRWFSAARPRTRW